MSTNADYITDALKILGVISSVGTLQAEDGSTMLRVLNGMLDSFRDEGIDIGIAPQTSTTDTIYPKDGTSEALKYLLAARAASTYKVALDAEAATFATNAYLRLKRAAVYNDRGVIDFDHLPFNQRYGSRILTGI